MEGRGSWTGKRIALTLLAAALVVLGLMSIGRGVIALQDSPRPPNRSVNLYVMSGQVEDIGGGLIAIALAVMAYRYGRTK